MKITNNHQIDLPMAVWLLQDGYQSGAKDAPEGELISATTLMKPTKQLILKRKVEASAKTMDVADMIASRMGHGLHDSIERAWTEGDWQGAMRKLGFPQKTIETIVINPDPKDVEPGQTPIYLEKRGFRQFDDVVITGQLDFIIGAAYRDFKSTSTFAWTSGNKDEDYILQGSIYRWLFPDLIKNDLMRIEFIFTDWAKYRAKADPNYPQTRITHREFKLMSIEDTEQWILDKLAHIRKEAKLLKTGQENMERCTPKQLWQSEPKYKYYSNPETAAKGGKCQKSFDSPTDAQLWLKEKGKGTIVTVPGEVKACEYCDAFLICQQRKEYFNDDLSRPY